MKNIAPHIVRQRLLIEGYFTIDVNEETIARYLFELTEHLNVTPYGEPIVYVPATGMGAEINQGYDAFIPLIDSGISLYVWSNAKFFSTVIYTCKTFDEKQALEYTRNYFKVTSDLIHLSF